MVINTDKESLSTSEKLETLSQEDAIKTLEGKYDFTRFETDIVSQVPKELAPNLALLIRYRASKFDKDVDKEQFLTCWKSALPDMWNEEETTFFSEPVDDTGDLQVVQLFNAYQPRSSKSENANRPLSLTDLEQEAQNDPEAAEFIQAAQDVTKFLYIQESDDSNNLSTSERREMFRNRLQEWRQSGKSLPEFINDFSHAHPDVSYKELPIYKEPEDRTVIEDVVMSAYVPAIAKSLLDLNEKSYAPDTIALQKNTSDMIKNEFPELSLLLVEAHKEELIRLGTGSATHTLAPMFPEELETQYGLALANHLLTLEIRPEDKKDQERVIVPLHIPECATTPKLWQTLGKLQDKFNITYVTSVDSQHHIVPGSKADLSGINRLELEDDNSEGVLLAIRDNPFSMQFAFPDNVDLTIHESVDDLPVDKYCINGLSAILKNGFSKDEFRLKHLAKKEDAVILRQTDFEEIGHHQRGAPFAARKLDKIYRKFGVEQISLEELAKQKDSIDIKLESDIRAEASWGGHDKWAFYTWMNPNNKWLYSEIKGVLKLAKDKINEDMQEVFDEDTKLEDLPYLMYQELNVYDSDQINAMSSYDMLKETVQKIGQKNGKVLTEEAVRRLFIKVSCYEDLMSSCPYWWSPQEMVPEPKKVEHYANKTPTVNQAKMAALNLIEYTIRYASAFGDFEELADHYFSNERSSFVINSGDSEHTIKVDPEMREKVSQRILKWLEKRKDDDDISRQQYEHWKSLSEFKD